MKVEAWHNPMYQLVNKAITSHLHNFPKSTYAVFAKKKKKGYLGPPGRCTICKKSLHSVQDGAPTSSPGKAMWSIPLRAYNKTL